MHMARSISNGSKCESCNGMDPDRPGRLKEQVEQKGPLCNAPGCGKYNPGLKCARCLSAAYCNAECQKADWKAHRSICKAAGPETSAAASAAGDGCASSALEPEKPVFALLPKSNERKARELNDLLMNAVHAAQALRGPDGSRARQAISETIPVLKRMMAAGARARLVPAEVGPAGRKRTAYVTALGYASVWDDLAPVLDVLLKTDKSVVNAWYPAQGGGSDEPITCMMHNCLSERQLEVLKVLIKHGADCDAFINKQPSGEYVRALHVASMCAFDVDYFDQDLSKAGIAAARLRIKGGAKVNGLSYPSATQPLHMSIGAVRHDQRKEFPHFNYEGMPLFLLGSGADINHVRKDLNAAPIDCACRIGLPNVARILFDRGADPQPRAVRANVTMPVGTNGKRLGAFPDGDRSTWPMRHYVEDLVGADDDVTLRLAIERGLKFKKLRTTDFNSRPMLAQAIHCGSDRCVKVLLDAGADVNQVFKERVVHGPIAHDEAKFWRHLTPMEFALRPACECCGKDLRGNSSGERRKKERIIAMLRVAGGMTVAEVDADLARQNAVYDRA